MVLNTEGSLRRLVTAVGIAAAVLTASLLLRFLVKFDELTSNGDRVSGFIGVLLWVAPFGAMELLNRGLASHPRQRLAILCGIGFLSVTNVLVYRWLVDAGRVSIMGLPMIVVFQLAGVGLLALLVWALSPSRRGADNRSRGA